MSSIQNIDKIFVDPREELSFLMDRIREIEDQNIVLVIPQNSVIFASALTLKILYRLVLKANKLVVIVTEDSYGVNISQKAGFIVVNKVSQITHDLWQVVETKKDAFEAALQRKKNELLGIETPETEAEAILPKDEGAQNETIEIDLDEEVSEDGEVTLVEEAIESDSSEIKGLKADESELVGQKVSELEDLEPRSSDKDDQDEEVLGLESLEESIENVKSIGGIKIFGGNDVEEIKKKSKIDDKINKLDNFSEMSENRSREVNRNVFGENKFAGRDFTRSVRKKSEFSLFGFLKSKPSNPDDRISDLADKSFKGPFYKRRGFLIILSIIFVLLLVGYLVVFRWARATVNIYLVKQEVEAEENLRLNTEVEFGEVDVEQRILPAAENQGDIVTESRTGEANGESKRGEKANGFVYIFNKSRDEITLAQGTKFTNTTTNLVYELPGQVVLPAATVGDDLSTSPSRTDDVKLRAVAIGDEYNIDNPADNSFTIDGYSGFSTLEAKQDSAFEGGTSESFKSVSEDNVEDLKEKILNDLKPKALSELKLDVPNGYTLVEESVEYEEVKISSKPDIGEEATKGTFDLSLEILAKGLIVSDEDVEEIISTSISLDEDDEESIQRNVNSIEDVTFTDFVKNDSGLFLTIAAKGDVTEGLTEEDIFNAIKSKSFNSATNELKKMEGIRTFEIRIYPSLIPQFMQFVPSNIKNVDIELQ
jgi:hypothetical protein